MNFSKSPPRSPRTDKVFDRVYNVNPSSVKLDPIKVISFDKRSRRFAKDPDLA